jgi:endo-1,4-beta-D-glucanase Y
MCILHKEISMRTASIPLFLLFAVFFACTNTGTATCAEGDESCKNSGGNNNNGESSGSGGEDNGELGSHAALPSNINAARVQEMYNTWISTYYITYDEDLAKGTFSDGFQNPQAVGTARIRAAYSPCPSNDGRCSCSEAIGYGMILTALMEDFGRFDKLLAFNKVFRYSSTALMQWDVRSFVDASGRSATDADIDIVAALLIAYKKSGEQRYLNDALEIGASIYEWEIESSSKLVLPAMYNDGLLTKKGIFYNISYFSLPALKMLAQYDKSRNWNAVLDANLAYMKRVQDAGDGLWPDWSDANGNPINPDNNSNEVISNVLGGGTFNSYESYYKEAPRIPWRIAWYYHWYGDERAKAMLNRGMEFLRSKGVSRSQDLKNFYSYKGGKEGSSEATVARWPSLCALGLGDSSNRDWMNACNERILGNFSPALSSYYANSLQIIYAMLFNGKF